MNNENNQPLSDSEALPSFSNNNETAQNSFNSVVNTNSTEGNQPASNTIQPNQVGQLKEYVNNKASSAAVSNINNELGPGTTTSTSSPLTLFLQWVTYALWGWTLIPLSWLTLLVTSFYIVGDIGTDEFAIYLIASIVVLGPMAIIADHYFDKKETQPKKSGSSVIMLIHAVIFVLFSLGFYISTVFALISVFMSSGSSELKIAIAVGSFIVGCLYLLLIIRTIKPNLLQFKQLKIRPFILIMLFVIAIIFSLAIAGPVKRYFDTRDDRLIESHLSDVSVAINKYYAEKQNLPDSLNALSVDPEVKQLIDSDLVKYEQLGSSGPSLTVIGDVTKLGNYLDDTYELPKQYLKYQLCVNYVAESNIYDSSEQTDELQTYISTYSHPKGEVCYKLKTN